MILAGCSSEQNAHNKTLAQVGGKKISAGVFEKRLLNFTMLTPIDEPQVRRALLENMINEKVLVLEAEQRGLAAETEYQDYCRRLAIDAMLDAYKDDVAGVRPEVSENEVVREFALQNEKARARHLHAATLEEANRLYERLNSGESFDALAAETFEDRELAQRGGDLGYFTWEEMDPAFSAAAQKLRAGEISTPIKTHFGYSIIKLEDRFRKPILTESEFTKNKKRLAWEVRHRKRADALREHGKKILAELKVSFNESTLERLWAEFDAARRDSTTRAGAEQPPLFKLDQELALVTVGGKLWRVKDFQSRAQWTSEGQRRSLRTKDALKEFINGLAIRDELIREARAKGWERSPQVRATIAERSERLLIDKMRAVVIDAVRVPEDSLRAEYEKNPRQYVFPCLVNVREITVAARDEAEKLLAQVMKGADFAAVARRHSLHAWSRQRGGEVGFAAKGDYGPLGEAIFALSLNEFGGPYQNGEYFTIVQVLEIRPEQQKNFEQAKEEIAEGLIEYFKQSALTKQIEKWRQGYTVSVDSLGLGKVKSPLAKSSSPNFMVRRDG